jgi:hypothetical protein
LAGTDSYTKQLATQTEEQIQKAHVDLKAHADEVIDFLLKVVADVRTDYKKDDSR